MPLSAFTNVFAGNPLDRASERRTDAAWIAARLSATELLALAMWNGRPLVEDAPASEAAPMRLAWLSAAVAARSSTAERTLFLGLWKDRAVFAFDFEEHADPAEDLLEGLGRFEELRGVAMSLPGPEAAIAATAKAVFEWRRRHRHCAVCGHATHAVEGGWKRACPNCGAEHFPRTDPVVIMLAHREGRCLLGRQAAWPSGMYSALAGFVEPGESLEEACAREVREEAALEVSRVRYHSTQPWPYPSSLMIGLIAEVEMGEAVADQTELEEVRWFDRAEARALLARQTEDRARPRPWRSPTSLSAPGLGRRPPMTPDRPRREKRGLERWLETLLFASRWVLAPFYVGLVAALLGLLVVFVREVVNSAAHILTMKSEDAILAALSLIDLSLAGNLVVLVTFSGYENFVSKMESARAASGPPGWAPSISPGSSSR